MMNNFFYVGIVISTLLSTLIIYYIVKRWVLPKIEGFKQTEDKQENPLLNLISKMKRMTNHLVSPSTWIERIEMVNMSPAELARRHLKSIAKTE